MSEKINNRWLYVISSNHKLFSLNLNEVWRYRDLLFLFVKRDIVTAYKQTVLGPLWYIIQPLFTSVIFTLVFNNIANISTGQVPSFLFNLSGVTAWGYFKSCLTGTSNTFRGNSGLFAKVYFPRAITPLSVVVSNLVRFGIQFVILIGFTTYFVLNGMPLRVSWNLLYLPIVICSMGVFGLGLGMIISSMVTKYRDFSYLVSFGVQLLMYMSAVMYPLDLVKEKVPKYFWLVELNPMSIVIETFRNIVLGINYVSVGEILWVFLLSFLVALVGLVIFNKTEKSFLDTV